MARLVHDLLGSKIPREAVLLGSLQASLPLQGFYSKTCLGLCQGSQLADVLVLQMELAARAMDPWRMQLEHAESVEGCSTYVELLQAFSGGNNDVSTKVPPLLPSPLFLQHYPALTLEARVAATYPKGLRRDVASCILSLAISIYNSCRIYMRGLSNELYIAVDNALNKPSKV